jgi:ATP-dependent helicase HrpA
MTETAAPTAGALAAKLPELTAADGQRLGRRLAGIRRIKDSERRVAALADLAGQFTRAEARVARRRAAVGTITFPAELPVSARVDDLMAAIEANQVVIVAGETGSGKSTQLPKICLKLGRGVRGLIGHTQPRRIAARSLAERIAEETGTELGRLVGYTTRFGDHTGPDTMVRLMTDGILLAEITRDRELSRYDTIIIDEAHERSLNIDFLLGYLTQLLPRRPDLKVIITSATIDPQRFSAHFGGAPIVEVSGRTYPVEMRYRPYGPAEGAADDAADADDPDSARPPADAARRSPRDEAVDQATAICRAVDELAAQGDGDVLVFLSGEREITDTAEVLRGHLAGSREPTEVLPLYGRLSIADQHRVFSAHAGRRIVLSTNVAETSLTVPGIRYVVDPGTARISRYSTRTKVQRLPIEKISQASAGQRAGRCGRVADGICIRLYGEQDFLARPEFTDPEIARTSLASVILQMASLGLGDVASFPFVDPPDPRQISDGITVLEELGALGRRTGSGPVTLTDTGRALAALPVDPRLARMIVEGDRLGCLREVLVITAALAIQDVREYPLDDRERATAAHSRFVDPHSDFLALLNLWQYLADQGKTLSGNAFRRMCKREYLHYLRIREWQDLHGQLAQIARGLGMDPGRTAPAERRTDPPPRSAEGSKRRRGKGSSAFAAAAHRAAEASDPLPAAGTEAGAEVTPPGHATQQGKGSLAASVDAERVHTALLAGLLSHVGLKLEPGREFQGTRGTTFAIWPGSALAKAPPRFVMAAELVETSRLWGRLVARIDPVWAEKVGAHLVRRSHSEPRWEARRGSVVATERVTLLGVTLVAARTVQYDRIDPELSRDLFIRKALVERDWESRHRFLADNAAAIAAIEEREDRVRRRDLVVDDETLYALYDARIPADVTSAQAFDAWWKRRSREAPELLTFTEDELTATGAGEVSAESFPDRFTSGGLELDLDYVFDPVRADDGVTVTIPLAVLARVDPAAFGAQIPGLREDLAVGLLRTLPKSLRRNFVPAPDFARAALARMGDRASGDLPTELAAELSSMTGIRVAAADFDQDKLPTHLRMGFRVVDDVGAEVATGKDLRRLREDLRADTRAAVAQLAGGVEQGGLTAFPDDPIPPQIVRSVDGQEVSAYPALVDEITSVGVAVFTSAADQTRAMRAGTVRLLGLRARSAAGFVRYQLSRDQLLTLSTAPQGSFDGVIADATTAAIDALLDWAGGPAWDRAAFAALSTKLAPHLDKAVLDVVVAGTTALRSAHRAQAAVQAVTGSRLVAQIADMKVELAAMVGPGFLTSTTAAGLPDLDRYLQALAVRAERIEQNPDRDRERMAEVLDLATEIDTVVATLRPERRNDPDVRAVRRMLAEFRLAQFAQPMRTAIPVSAKRIRAAAAALRHGAQTGR